LYDLPGNKFRAPQAIGGPPRSKGNGESVVTKVWVGGPATPVGNQGKIKADSREKGGRALGRQKGVAGALCH